MKTKKTLKLSIICDNNQIIHNFAVSSPNIHDTNFTVDLLAKCNTNLKKDACIIGDKGYISKKNFKKLKRKKINLITPLRSNQKNAIKENNKNKNKLKNRFKVESAFSHIKRSFRRLQLVFDRKLINFITFIKMAITCQIIKFMNI